jgi:hypothetical protein
MQTMIRLTALILLASSAATPVQAAECTDVAGVGFVIGAPGSYCLSASISSGIRIEANDVTLDLNGHTVSVSPGDAGVDAFGRSGITVRNGRIHGGHVGVRLSNSPAVQTSGNAAEGLHISGSTACGICVDGHGSVVRNNVVIGVGDRRSVSYGIAVGGGAGARVSGNQVVDMAAGSAGVQANAILAADAPGAVIEGNVVSNSVAPPPGEGRYPVGISIFRSGSNFMPMKAAVAGNYVFNMRIGIESATVGVVSLFRDNAVGGAATPYQGGVMAGTSNHSF